MMARALDVAADILSRAQTPTVDGKVILKLLYYTQAWHLTWFGTPLYLERIEAWKYGPVVADVWRFGNVKGMPVSRVVGGDRKHVDERAQAVVSSVIGFYGARTGDELSALTHRETPWLHARIGLPDDVRSQTVIAPKAIRSFHTAQLLAGVPSPRRPETPLPQHEESRVREVAQFQERHWSSTLDWLATR